MTSTFIDAKKAREVFEEIRWPNGPVCPRCNASGDAVSTLGETTGAPKEGCHFCKKCRTQFTVTAGTQVFHRTRIELDQWLLAIHLLAAPGKGASTVAIQQNLGVTYKTAHGMVSRMRATRAKAKVRSPKPKSRKARWWREKLARLTSTGLLFAESDGQISASKLRATERLLRFLLLSPATPKSRVKTMARASQHK